MVQYETSTYVGSLSASSNYRSVYRLMKAAALPESANGGLAIAPSTTAAVDEAVATLQANRAGWPARPLGERIELLAQMKLRLLALAPEWVSYSLQAKGVQPGTLAEAEEWIFLATIFRALRIARGALAGIAKTGRPPVRGPVRTLPNGQVAVRVLPHGFADVLPFYGIRGEVWMEPGVTEEELWQTQASAFRQHGQEAVVAAVLGAGNASVLPIVDLLHMLFVEQDVAVLKLSPVNSYLAPLIAEVIEPLSELGVVQLLTGGAETGAYLCAHPGVARLHMTGSHRTYEAITFGPGAEGEERKKHRRPLLEKPFTCELGNITPVIVVPGPWQAHEIREQAQQLATWLTANAGYGCLTPRLLIQHESWPLREALVEALAAVLASVESRPAYYPGTEALHSRFVAAYPQARLFQGGPDGHLPWTLIPGLDADSEDELGFQEEAFCGLLAETGLAAADPVAFLDRAVTFANERLWGSLTVTLLVHPDSAREPAVRASIEEAITRLRYGTVTVNLNPYAAYHFMVTPWGAYPGHPDHDIQSGRGKTANFLMFDRPQKSVVTGPFRNRFQQVTIAAPRPQLFAQQLARYEAQPSPLTLARLAVPALVP